MSNVSMVDGHIDEPRMADNEIIKALECCCGTAHDSCRDCPYDDIGCEDKLEKDALDLINRQKAEIERLNKRIAGQKHALFEQQSYTAELQNEFKTAKSEAIKEFEHKLFSYLGVGHLRPPTEKCFSEIEVKRMIERVGKEMEELWKVIEQ